MTASAALPAILDQGRSPADWCVEFEARGIHLSERSLRQKARELGACHVIGKAMIITPAQIDAILEDCRCPSNHRRYYTSHTHRRGV
jgi:hypothetical protein